jgi:tetratricopeptide (TPR) repeat protein
MLRPMRSVYAAVALAPLIAAGFPACASAPDAGTPKAESPRTEARLYDGYGGYHRAISTQSAEAQRWFDQGLQLLYGFNHDEAIRSFRRAAELDPSCGMAWWGVAYANGLHINKPEMTEAASKAGWDAAQEALKRVEGAAPVEQGLIRAVAQRYAWPVPADRKPLDEAYAQAMAAVWKAFPKDADVGALYAESLMDLQPWDYWTLAGEPKGRALLIVAVLENVMLLDPQHPGGNHFYIHAVEASKSPERAVAASERLSKLVPGSGHLVHMPSHIWIRTGRYGDAADTNARAIAADRAYFAVAPPPDFYSLYFAHNIHFLAYATMMEGRFAAALEAARTLEREVPDRFVQDHTKVADGLMPVALHVLLRFGKWQAILDEPEPAEFRLVSRSFRHYARAVALSNLGRTQEARGELAALDALAGQIDATWTVGINQAPYVLKIARAVAEGEVLFSEDHREEAFASLREAVRLEDELVYDEPPGWMQPARHALGALLVVADRAAEAEQVYRADLARHPGNGWSLTGLRAALAQLGREQDASALDAQVAAAWARSDARPTVSCYCAVRGG